ncbi:MAG: hypothetical protein ACE10G_07745, partial [Gemmatimonadales bacterium]
GLRMDDGRGVGARAGLDGAGTRHLRAARGRSPALRDGQVRRRDSHQLAGTSEESVGMVYTGITAGDFRAAFSGGISFPFGSQSGFSEDPLLMLGGEVRATKSLKFITENWIVPGEDAAILSFGFRIIQSRLTVEAAVVTSPEGGGFLPLVNFSTTW